MENLTPKERAEAEYVRCVVARRNFHESSEVKRYWIQADEPLAILNMTLLGSVEWQRAFEQVKEITDAAAPLMEQARVLDEAFVAAREQLRQFPPPPLR